MALVPGEVLRLLLVSTDHRLQAMVEDALRDHTGEHKLYYVSQPESALSRASDLIPHVILLDDELGGMRQAALIAQITQRAPRAVVFALIGRHAQNAASAAVLAGARAFLVKPVNGAELYEALQTVLDTGRNGVRRDPMPVVNGKIIAFCAPKGGTGRTTIAVNSAVAIHQLRREPVVVVDGDYAAPALDITLNLDPSRNIVDLLPRLNALDAETVSSVLATHTSGLRVLLAPLTDDTDRPISLPQAQQVLAWLKRMFPWVVVDLGLPMDDTAFAFLDGADRIVLTVLPEMVGLRNTRLMLDQLRERGYTDDKIWIVLNRCDLRSGVSQLDIENRLKVVVRYKIPDDQGLATHTVNRGVPLMVSHPNSGLARAVRKFAAQLADDVAPPRPAEPAGLFGRMLGRGPAIAG